MDIFVKTFENVEFGQMVAIRDYCTEEELPKVDVMFNYNGSVQRMTYKFDTDELADDAFVKIDITMVEKAASEVMEALIAIGV